MYTHIQTYRHTLSHFSVLLTLQTKRWLLETEQLFPALFGYIDVLITWLMNANYITVYLMPKMPIATSSEFPSGHFYPGFQKEQDKDFFTV